MHTKIIAVGPAISRRGLFWPTVLKKIEDISQRPDPLSTIPDNPKVTMLIGGAIAVLPFAIPCAASAVAMIEILPHNSVTDHIKKYLPYIHAKREALAKVKETIVYFSVSTPKQIYDDTLSFAAGVPQKIYNKAKGYLKESPLS